MTSDDAQVDDVIVSTRRALGAGLNTVALDLVRELSRSKGDDAIPPPVRYLGALACVRMGAGAEAQAWLRRLDPAAIADRQLAVDVWSLSGRIAKERYAATRDRSPDKARDHARAALAGYAHAFELSGSAYPAVNAATMAMLLGEVARARDLAHRALAAAESAGDEAEHWRFATRGEALLLLDRMPEARNAYVQARACAASAFGDIASMRAQLVLIGTDAAHQLLDCVAAPPVIAFSGHMIDAPDRRSPRFPPALEGVVAEAIARRVGALSPAIGYAQAACGADILFLEAMQAAGMQTHVVLPCANDDFLASSVRFAGEAWVTRFHQVLARATSRTLATDEPLLGDDVLFTHASNLIHGMARLRAAELYARPLLLALHDSSSTAHEGGTAATTAAWRAGGLSVDTIDLAALRGALSGTHAQEPPAAPNRAAIGRSIKSVLFADVQGFSRLPEQYTPRFVELFLGTCKRLLDRLDRHAVTASTQGDGVFIVFERAAEAAQFALQLQHELAVVDWSAIGLPATTRARIGLHTGPVFRTYDPVMDRQTYYGTHVNRTARLEPVVQPGHVFATEAFAASLAAEHDERFRCRYIGEMPLAKHFGDARLYRLADRADD